MKLTMLLLLTVMTLAGCASQSVLRQGGTNYQLPAPLSCSTSVPPEGKVKLNMVDSLSQSGRQHAALAELLATKMGSVKHWLRYAQLQAVTGHMKRGKVVYQYLVDQCNSAEALHGLGMIQIKQGHISEGKTTLKEAASRLPAQPAVRNDYGYVLLITGNLKAAVFQLKTALELSNGKGAARENLAVTYLLANNQDGIKRLKQRYNLSDGELNYAKQLARQLGRYQSNQTH